MTEENKDSKKEEVQPSSEESTEKKEPDKTQVEDTTQKTEVEGELKDKLTKAEKKAGDFERAFLKEKEKNRERDLTPEVSQPEEELDDYDKGIDTRIDKKLKERDVVSYNENLKLAIQDIHDKYPEYKPENDINNINWDKLEPLIKATAFPNNRQEMFKRIEILHRGITQPISPDNSKSDPEKVDDSGAGNVPTSPEGKDEQPDIMTRPLNKWEQKAFEIGKSSGIYKTEKDYREKLAE